MTTPQNAALIAVGFAALSSISCSTIRKQVQGERQGNFPMVDVTGKNKADAESELRSYGITGSVSVVDNYVCHDRNVKEGHVCYTSPRAGNATSSRLPVTLYLRPTETLSYVMPDVRGKTAEEAKQILIGLGQHQERFVIEEMRGWLDECEPSRVCRQSPAPGQKTQVNISKWLDIAPATRPVRPTPPPPVAERDADARERPTREPQESPKPKASPPPEPIF